jgi:hypothetical protein
MKPQNVDLVLLVDSSESMRPCFASLREHLKDLLYPLQQANFRVRFGLVAYAAGRDRGVPVYDHTFIGGSGPEMIQKLYSPSVGAADFFTSDSAVVTRVLSGLEAQGNEDTLLALDIAADFPFGSPESTRRVIAVFTDEPLEAGVAAAEPMAKIPNLIQKLMSRRIQLFVSAPFSPAMEQLGSLDRAEIEAVDGGDGLKSVDFKKLLAQMGKSISVSSLQMGPEPAWQKAIFGQDKFEPSRFSSAQDKSVIVRSGEIGGIVVNCSKLGVLLDVSPSMTAYLPALRRQIGENFADAKYREEQNCMLSSHHGQFAGGNLRKLKELIMDEGCDGIYWFSDFQDRREASAIASFREDLEQKRVKLYIRSTERNPRDLIELSERTGGGFKNGIPESLSE